MALPVLLYALQAEPTRVILERGGLEQVALIGQAVISVVVLGLLLVAIVTLLALRKALDELTRLVRSTSSDITAAVHDAREVADELRRLTGRVRDAADFVSGGVQRVRKMADNVRRDGQKKPVEESNGSERIEGGERSEGQRERSERRRRKRRRSGERPRPAEGGTVDAPAPTEATGE